MPLQAGFAIEIIMARSPAPISDCLEQITRYTMQVLQRIAEFSQNLGMIGQVRVVNIRGFRVSARVKQILFIFLA